MVELGIGQRRVILLEGKFEKQGFFVLPNYNFNSGVDLIIIDKKGKIAKVIE